MLTAVVEVVVVALAVIVGPGIVLALIAGLCGAEDRAPEQDFSLVDAVDRARRGTPPTTAGHSRR